MDLLNELQSGVYHAILDEKTVCSGSLPKVVAYIAQQRAEGLDVKGGAAGTIPEVQERRRLHLENCITLHPVGFRLVEINAPKGFYSSQLFASASEAEVHRAEILHDPEGQKYTVENVNWRGARL